MSVYKNHFRVILSLFQSSLIVWKLKAVKVCPRLKILQVCMMDIWFDVRFGMDRYWIWPSCRIWPTYK